ncbi:MAG: glycosyltransferase family 2 protein [Candidatus Omnitrophota bacterium]|nr:MAG: glycosyltransferase family 2 protein [Candidatus Omnitrophota bacterium]
MNIPILIPVYNEQSTIGELVRRCIAYANKVYVVDDGSEDRSGEIARREGAIVIRHRRNKGKGAALRKGLEKILCEQIEAVIMMDGDGQHDPSEIPRFIQKFKEEGADIVLGNRTNRRVMPLIRRLTNKFMSLAISWMTGQNLPDTQCGFRLVRDRVLRDIDLKACNFEIESEMLIKGAQKGYKIVSVPISTIYHQQRSKIKPFIDTYRFLKLIASHIRKEMFFV